MVELAAVETWRGELVSAAVHLHEAERAAHALGLPELYAATLAHRCVLDMAVGNYRTAADTASAALDADLREVLPSDVRARAHLARGWAATYELDTAAAHAALDEIHRHPEPADPVVHSLLRLMRCRVLNQEGDPERALRLLASSDVLDGSSAFLVRLAGVIEAESAARSHASAALRGAVSQLRGGGFDEEVELFECVAPTSPGAVALALQRLDVLLSRADLHPATGASAAAVRMCLVLQARDYERACALLPDLLSRVQPQRLLIFLDVVAGVAPDFLHLLFHDVESDHSQPSSGEVLAFLRRTHQAPARDPFTTRLAGADLAAVFASSDTSDPRIGTSVNGHSLGVHDKARASSTGPAVDLTRRQFDVLAQLAIGASYAEIARNLFVTENTVKTHVVAIYRKLEVTRCSDALLKARQYGLI